MKKIVRVKCKSFCPLSNEGVHSSLNEIEDMLDTLNKLKRAKQRKPKVGTFICNNFLPLIKLKGDLTHALLRYSNFCVIVSSV